MPEIFKENEEKWDSEEMSGENIKYLVFREEPEETVFPMYRSKFSKQVREEVKNRKLCHQTMGLPTGIYLQMGAEDFLKKKSRIVKRPDIDKTKPLFPPKPPVPRRDEWKNPPEKSSKNFISTNIHKVVNSTPKSGPSRPVDMKTGEKFHNCIVLLPKFIYRKGFGKVPKYVKTRKKENEEELLEYQRHLNSMKLELDKQKLLKVVPAEERETILGALKIQWETLQKEFQLLPMIVDTPPQIKRKSNLEKSLANIEKDIDMLERNPIIYLYNNSI